MSAETVKAEWARYDERIEDVARTLHCLEALEPERYWRDDYAHGWENEYWGAVKATRNRARELIERFDARASEAQKETPDARP